MGGLHLEGAIIGPQVDRVGDTRASTLIYLDEPVSRCNSFADMQGSENHPYYFCRLWPRDVELEIGIFLPVTEE